MRLTKEVISYDKRAEFKTYKIKAKDSEELKLRVKELISQCRYEHGHSGYTGTIAESNGQVIICQQKMNEENAEEYIFNHAKKWEDNIAVYLEDEDCYLLGGFYSC